MSQIGRTNARPHVERSDSVQAVVGLRVLWRGMERGSISSVEPRNAGGPIVSITLDDGTELHGVTVGEWETNSATCAEREAGKGEG